MKCEDQRLCGRHQVIVAARRLFRVCVGFAGTVAAFAVHWLLRLRDNPGVRRFVKLGQLRSMAEAAAILADLPFLGHLRGESDQHGSPLDGRGAALSGNRCGSGDDERREEKQRGAVE